VHKHTTASKQFNNAIHKFTSTHKTYYSDITVAQVEKHDKRGEP